MLHRKRRSGQSRFATGLWLSAMTALVALNLTHDLHRNANAQNAVMTTGGHEDQPPLDQVICLIEQLLGGECQCHLIPDPPPPPPMPDEPPT